MSSPPAHRIEIRAEWFCCRDTAEADHYCAHCAHMHCVDCLAVERWLECVHRTDGGGQREGAKQRRGGVSE
ncbi:hypothetical protein BDY21DRAFT_374571 [Lineolata rhizophorae]|uniref:Uncharacterized protein n=1 Tax=Lineolata rhizophorae TaxID=578093 RepID=A0A6A6NQ16_9PEZI|nr:hypothetical protein BDY21DRAFT_374571 [Lineolata rhizophorae]